MRIHRLGPQEVQGIGSPEAIARRLRGLVAARSSVEARVREIVGDVREGGDRALAEWTRRLDPGDPIGGGVNADQLTVKPGVLDEAIKGMDLDVVAGLQVAIANVAAVAEVSVGQDVAVSLPQGHRVVVREIPVSRAAVYVPGGRAPYASTVVMGVVTARAAGVLDVVVCSPPGHGGEIDPTILGTCRLVGVQTVHRMGGAQAIAALAYGTETIARVDVVVGPGNLYVQEAKRQVSGVVAIDGFAGPSDLMVLLGDDCDARILALDLLAQIEHGEGTIVVAVSHSPAALDALATAVEELSARHPELTDGACAIVDVASAMEAIALANEFAPEHLQLVGSEVEALAGMVRTAGCVFVGRLSGTAFGDYVVGSNHILPTEGAARFQSSLSPRHFRRRMAEVRLSGESVGMLARAGGPIARAEGFDLHAQSMEARIGDNG